MHTPVLLKEAIDCLAVRKDGRYIDATVGEGGHLKAILEHGGTVLGIDWDKQQIEKLKSNFEGLKVMLRVGNYSEIEHIAKENNFVPVDGIMFDLGLSMAQMKNGKGFSFRQKNDFLDMRIGHNIEETAADLLAKLNEQALYEVFSKYSEELDSKIIAHEIVISRSTSPIQTVGDLIDVIEQAIAKCSQKHMHNKMSTITRIFQALRVVVNDEFNNIRRSLEGAVNIVKDNGRIVVITFHSLEDRIVEQYIRSHQLISEEIIKGSKQVSFERSATLRVIKK